MHIRAYLRASTTEQDATRAKKQLLEFAKQYGHKVAATYTENASGAAKGRLELQRLLGDSEPGDVLLIEAVDRLTRLVSSDWEQLKAEIKQAGVLIVSIDLPTSYQIMEKRDDQDQFTLSMLNAINSMLLDMLAAIARKDYEQRRERQAQGIEKAKLIGKYKGRPINLQLRKNIMKLSEQGNSIREVANILKCSTTTVQATLKVSRSVDILNL